MTAYVEVIDAGLLTTVQDEGRPGWAHLGVPRGGALDRAAARRATALVGNPDDRALLETTVTGMRWRAGSALTFAVTGAQCDVRVDGRAREFGTAVSVRAGAEVVVGPARRGVRSYVAFAGGIDVEPVLGSRSTDTLAWVGPDRLRAGDRLPLGSSRAGMPGVDWSPASEPVTVLRMHAGPRVDWVERTSLEAVGGTPFRIQADSDRVGLRLQGPVLVRSTTRELASEGVVLGAVQLPPSGQPVVFLADHPVTGGYPVIGVIDPADLDGCAQLRPGDEVWLQSVGPGFG